MKKKITALVLALLMVLSLCACGRSANTSASYTAPASAYNDYAAEAAMDVYYDGEAGFGAYEESASTAARKSDADVPEENPEKIIYSADATVETTEFEKTIEALLQLVEANGGFVESSSVNGSNYYDSSRGRVSNRRADYTLRIPSDRFSGLMSSLSTLGNVPYTYTYTENVTAQYYDVQARLTAYQAQETRLLEMLELAETVEDIITIEDKLTDVRYRIDSLQSSLNNWDRRVNYSTLNLGVQEVQVYTPETVAKVSYGQRLWNAFTGALKSTRRFFQDLLVFLVSALPTLAILAVLFFVFRPLLKKWHAKGQVRREAKRVAKAAKKAEKAAPTEAEE